VNRSKISLKNCLQSTQCLFWAAFIMRIVFALYVGLIPTSEDPGTGEYGCYVTNFLQGKGFVCLMDYPTPHTIYYARLPPLYPMILIAYIKLFGPNLIGLRILFSFFGALTCLITSQLASLLMGRSKGIYAGWALCFYLGHIYWSTRFLPEGIVMLLSTTSLWLIVDAHRK